MSPQSVALHDLSVAQTRRKGDGIPAFRARQTSAKSLIGVPFSTALERLVENAIIDLLLPRRIGQSQANQRWQ
jgi:hypothetical protein